MNRLVTLALLAAGVAAWPGLRPAAAQLQPLPGPVQKWGLQFRQVDTDTDGQVSQDEFVAARADQILRNFDRLDTDRDGFLTAEEMYWKPVRLDREPRVRPQVALLARFDTNGDGRVSRDEYIAVYAEPIREQFAEMDIDKDGYLSRAELEAPDPYVRWDRERPRLKRKE